MKSNKIRWLLTLLAIMSIAVTTDSLAYAAGPESLLKTDYTPQSLKTELLSSPTYSKFSAATWETKTNTRDIDHLTDEALVELVKSYPEKINELSKMVNTSKEVDLISLNEKITRLKDKYILVTKEIAVRAAGVKREIHHTNYYIDLTNGNDSRTGLKIGNYTVDSTADTTHFVDASLTGVDDYINGSYVWNITAGAGSLITDFVALTDTVTLTTPIVGMAPGDTYYILDAWLTIEKYTSVTVRTDGDNAYVRANTTETKTDADIAFDEDATFLLPHSIIGCDSVTNDPWNDDSDVRPIINFNDAAYGFAGSGDDFWTIKRLDVRQSADTSAGFSVSAGLGWLFDDCIFREASASIARGLSIVNGSSAAIQNCSFYSNKTTNCNLSQTMAIMKSCVFNGGTDTTDYGLALSQSQVFMSDSSFGVTTAHDLYNVLNNTDSEFHALNTFFTGALSSVSSYGGICFSEDHNATRGLQYSISRDGTIVRDTTIQLDGLASANMTPASTVGLGLTLSQGYSHDYALWCTASTNTTVTIKARENTAWSINPTVAEFYFEASYLNHATAATRSTIASTQALSGTNEISFTMNFIPAQDGWAYILCYLKKYEAGKSVNVSVVPVIS